MGTMIEDSGTCRLGGFTVHRLGFGTMQLPGPGVWGPSGDHAGAIAVLRRAVELGVDLLDTADAYGPDVAEELIREALHPYPESLRIATKAGLTRSGPGEWASCGRPEYLRRQCEGSLERLGVERLDLFQLHRVDPAVPADEQFGVLSDLREEGKVAEVGLSEVGVDQIEAARRIVPLVSVQNQYNIATRGADDVVDYCEQNGIGFIPWAPLASG
jgi:aryl-alcohol dehydrogenase-like predicted oxidoreductase